MIGNVYIYIYIYIYVFIPFTICFLMYFVFIESYFYEFGMPKRFYELIAKYIRISAFYVSDLAFCNRFFT